MRQRTLLIIGILVALTAGLLFLQTPLMKFVRRQAWDVWVATIARLFRVGPLNISNDVTSQLQQLRSENIRLQAELADYERLRAQLRTPSVDSYRAIAAAVDGRPADGWQTEYVINRGAADGVNLGAPAVVNGSTLVGFVSSLHEHSAIVQLLLHPNTSVTVDIVAVGEKAMSIGRGLLVGRQFTALWLTTVPRDVPLQSGQPVVTVARADQIPPGLLIGTIDRVYAEENQAYQEATLTWPYNVDQLSAVTILVPQ